MFEIIGYATLRACGWGWLWGELPRGGADEVFGNGGALMLVGMGTSIGLPLVVLTTIAVIGGPS